MKGKTYKVKRLPVSQLRRRACSYLLISLRYL